MKIFSEKLRVFRMKKGLTQSKLADMLGVKPNTVSNYEKGISSPDLDMFVKIVNILDVSPSNLLGIEYNEEILSYSIASEQVKDYKVNNCEKCDLRERLIKSMEITIRALEARCNDFEGVRTADKT